MFLSVLYSILRSFVSRGTGSGAPDDFEGRSIGQYDRFGKKRASAIIMRNKNLSTSKGPDAIPPGKTDKILCHKPRHVPEAAQQTWNRPLCGVSE